MIDIKLQWKQGRAVYTCMYVHRPVLFRVPRRDLIANECAAGLQSLPSYRRLIQFTRRRYCRHGVLVSRESTQTSLPRLNIFNYETRTSVHPHRSFCLCLSSSFSLPFFFFFFLFSAPSPFVPLWCFPLSFTCLVQPLPRRLPKSRLSVSVSAHPKREHSFTRCWSFR